MNIHFYLDKPQLDKTVVMMSLSFDGYRVKLSTKKSVDTQLWDSKRERLKKSAMYASEINSYLSNLEAYSNNTYHEKNAIGEKITTEFMKAKVKSFFANPSLEKNIPDIISLYKEFIEERSESGKYRPSTIRFYKTAMSKVDEFARFKQKKIYLDDIGTEFYNEFTRFLHQERNMQTNTVSGIIKDFKTFLNDCLRKGLTTNIKFRDELQIKKYDTLQIALTEEELASLEKVEVDNERDKVVKDLFLIMCYTGIRSSDLVNLKPENIDLKEGLITLNMVKTSESLMIPIHPKLRMILEKYEGKKLPKVEKWHFNRRIKIVAKEAGIDEPTQLVSFYGSKRVEVTKPKYELVSSHTGRRTFITLTLKRGAMPEMVMKVSGHKSRLSFQKYVKISKNEAVEQIRNIWEKCAWKI